jgi:hypothetical protein
VAASSAFNRASTDGADWANAAVPAKQNHNPGPRADKDLSNRPPKEDVIRDKFSRFAKAYRVTVRELPMKKKLLGSHIEMFYTAG